MKKLLVVGLFFALLILRLAFGEPDETGCAVGSIFIFGTYEQDNDTTNGKEPIEWIILDKRADGTLVLLSKYALDAKPYYTQYTVVTWENCELRRWLNEDFYNAAFSAEEKAKIFSTKLVNEDNPQYWTNGGNDTEDKVWLLSINEVCDYFSNDKVFAYFTDDDSRICLPTKYAIAQGAFFNDSDINGSDGNCPCRWWLRSSGGLSNSAAFVNDDGFVRHEGGGSVIIHNSEDISVRPVVVAQFYEQDSDLSNGKGPINLIIQEVLNWTNGILDKTIQEMRSWSNGILDKKDSVNSDYYAQGVKINGVNMEQFTRSEGEKQVRNWANGILNKKYTFTFTDPDTQQIYSWEFTPSMVDASMNVDDVLNRAWALGHSDSSSDQSKVQQDLRNQPQYFTIDLSYNEEKFNAYLDSICYDEKIYIEPIDAEIVLTATRPQIYAPSSDGRELDREKFSSLLLNLMKNGSNTTVYELPVKVTIPSVSSNVAENGLQLIAEYSTDLSESSSDRCSNVQLALSKFNGFEVKPGESVSFNTIVGPRTILQGYKEATVYYGDTISQGVGGGVCQASSTLYGAVMYAGMDVVERYHHSLVVSYCAPSMDAAVSDEQDFIFKNNTDYTIYIYTNVINKTKATVYIYGNRPEYRIELVPTIIQNNIKNTASDIRIDTTGDIAYYKTDVVLVKEGKLGRKSKLERLYYDWDTNTLVNVELLSEDYYTGERDIYYQGIH